jgi:hypothetical protein
VPTASVDGPVGNGPGVQPRPRRGRPARLAAPPARTRAAGGRPVRLLLGRCGARPSALAVPPTRPCGDSRSDRREEISCRVKRASRRRTSTPQFDGRRRHVSGTSKTTTPSTLLPGLIVQEGLAVRHCHHGCAAVGGELVAPGVEQRLVGAGEDRGLGADGKRIMSPMWRASSITLALALISAASGHLLNLRSDPEGGANIGAGLLVMLAWGIGVLGVLMLVGAIIGDFSRARARGGR